MNRQYRGRPAGLRDNFEAFLDYAQVPGASREALSNYMRRIRQQIEAAERLAERCIMQADTVDDLISVFGHDDRLRPVAAGLDDIIAETLVNKDQTNVTPFPLAKAHRSVSSRPSPTPPPHPKNPA